jgi:enediyne biosynthesis protein E4
MERNVLYTLIVFSILVISACKKSSSNEEVMKIENTSLMFDLKDNKSIGIDFENTLSYDKDFNVYKYRNYYNGGGVSLGDINNDGLIDVYMVANQKKNKLYLNKGNWKFEDITDKAGVAGLKSWSTGVTMVDINADGLLDIYLCNSGDVKGDNKENELFINNGDLTFTEKAAEYGLNDNGYSTHASFFDYDKDGDLDCYILNNSFKAIGSFDQRKNQRNKRDDLGGDKLLENRNGKFVDVSAKAGIYGSEIGFGLGITVGDVNNDNWEDIYVSNDFFERDYLYINQKNGTFKEDLVAQMPSISGASMGADMADINNDGYNEIFVTEMLPYEFERMKTNTTFDDWNRYQSFVENGYHHQFTRNTLQLNNGNNTFSEVSRFAGVEASDWSWGALFFDMENDGLKDLFIANGIYKDLTNQDYLAYVANESVMKSIVNNEGVDYKKLIDIIPSNKVANHAYTNKGNLKFELNKNTGLMTPGFSNGSAYGDIDNDGDLDLIVNNVNMPCFIYENKTNLNSKNNYIKLNLKGEGKNTNAIGSKIEITAGTNKYYIENQPIRGFQSSMDFRPNVGVGKAAAVDVKITWPSGRITLQTGVKVNQILNLNEKDAVKIDKEDKLIVAKVLVETPSPIKGIVEQNTFNDFNRDPLNYFMLSTRGSCAEKGDLNGDKLIDIVMPGAKGIPTKIFIQASNGSFNEMKSQPIFEIMKEAEHIKCQLFDADKDGDLDMYLASGSVEHTEYSELLYDELLINDGKANFISSMQRLPYNGKNISTGGVANGDIDNDGDLDLLIGERIKINRYGDNCSGFLLQNDGKGKFVDVTQKMCPGLQNIGMITDLGIVDLDGDNKNDLIVVGEYMDVSIFKNQGEKFIKIDLSKELSGLWNALKIVDVNNDGKKDIVLANHGTNSIFKTSVSNPLTLYFNDFDLNGDAENLVTSKFNDGKNYPFILRHNLVSRIPSLKKKFPNFESFKKASIEDIFTKDVLETSITRQCNEMRSLILINKGSMKFEKSILPDAVQYSIMYAIEPIDIDRDGDMDLIMGGNLYNVLPEKGRYDASYGHILVNNGKGNFVDKSKDFNFSVKGEIRSILSDANKLYIFRNNDSVVSYQIK